MSYGKRPIPGEPPWGLAKRLGVIAESAWEAISPVVAFVFVAAVGLGAIYGIVRFVKWAWES